MEPPSARAERGTLAPSHPADVAKATGWRGRPHVALLIILVLAAVLRLAGLGSASLWYDEAASLYLGRYITEPTALFDSTHNTEPPVNALITGLWAGLIGVLSPTDVTDPAHDFLLRLLPVLFGILNVFLVYRLTRRLYGCTGTALCAALLFALAPFQIYYGQELRVYSLYITLALLAVECMLGALSEGRPRHWAGMVATLTMLMYSHYFSMWLIFTLNVAFVLRLAKYKHLLWRWTLANGILMALIAPALYRAFTLHGEVQEITIPWYPNPTWKTGLITFKTFFAGYGPTAWAYWPLFLLGLVLWLSGLRWQARDRDGTVLIACLTWLPVVGGIVLWARADFSFYEHRLFLFSGVAALMGVARGIHNARRPGLVAFALYLLFTLPCLADYYQGKLHPVAMHRLAMWDKVDFRGAARAMDERWQEGDRLAYTSHFSAYSMMHYAPHDQVRIGWGLEDEDVFIQTMGHEALLREHHLMPVPKEQAILGATRIWLLATHGNTFEWQPTTDRIRAWLATRATPGESITLDGLTVTCFTLSEPGITPN